MLLVGLSMMLYPIISEWWNSKVQSRAVASYDKIVAEIDEDRAERMIAKANDFNERLAQLYSPLSNPDQLTDYDRILNVIGTGVMGYVTIPVIRSELPIYHGTDEEVLNIASGHLKGTSFPVGGPSTHAVISAHRGLPSSRLFTDLDKLVIGDTFTVTVLNHVYTYEVDDISVILPEEIEKLSIIPDEDYVTLMTCTPYGVNTHRLLVRAKRMEIVEEKTLLVAADAVQVDSMLVIMAITTPLILLMIYLWVRSGKRKKISLPFNDPLSILSKKDGC